MRVRTYEYIYIYMYACIWMYTSMSTRAPSTIVLNIHIYTYICKQGVAANTAI